MHNHLGFHQQPPAGELVAASTYLWLHPTNLYLKREGTGCRKVTESFPIQLRKTVLPFSSVVVSPSAVVVGASKGAGI